MSGRVSHCRSALTTGPGPSSKRLGAAVRSVSSRLSGGLNIRTVTLESRRAVRTGRVLVVVAAAVSAAAFCVPTGSGGGRRPADGAGRVAIFYYPWYSTPKRDGQWAHWYVERDGVSTLSTRYFPTRGLYSSSNLKVTGAHMREIAAAGITTIVVSWWGSESPEAARLRFVLDAATQARLAVAVHIEPYPGRTPASTAHDIEGLQQDGVSDFYVYDADRDPTAAWAEALAGLEHVRVFGHTSFVGRAKASGFDGLYTYDVGTWNGSTFARICTQAHTVGLLCAPSVGPGYDARLATGHELVRPRRDGVTYDRMWRAAVRANADIVTITSYNEWQEGTQIEPARRQVGRAAYEGAWGKSGATAQHAYLDATAVWAARLGVSFP
jgi:glycoprotein endo-alpha-1,2-mannosidase